MAMPHARPYRNREIRKRYASGERMIDLAEEYGLSRQRIDQILRPRKHRARKAVTDALTRGVLERPDECERCGAPDPHGHHPDYSEPLAVEWICAKCHGEEHAGEHRVERVERVCPQCGQVDLVLPSRAARTAHCSRKCAAITSGAVRRFDREERVAEVAEQLADYVDSVSYIPGTTEFAMYMTGKPKGSCISGLCGYVDPNVAHFGSYAGVMDAIYEAAGFPRPRYGPLPLDSEAA